MMTFKSLLGRVSSSSSSSSLSSPPQPILSKRRESTCTECVILISENDNLKFENQNLKWENDILNSQLREMKKQVDAFETLVQNDDLDPIVHKLVQNLQKIAARGNDISPSSSASSSPYKIESPTPKRVTWSLVEPSYDGECSCDSSTMESYSIENNNNNNSDPIMKFHGKSLEINKMCSSSSEVNEVDDASTTKDTRKYFQTKLFDLSKREENNKEKEGEPKINIRRKLRPRSKMEILNEKRKLRKRQVGPSSSSMSNNNNNNKPHLRRKVGRPRKNHNLHDMTQVINGELRVDTSSTLPTSSQYSPSNPIVRLQKCKAAEMAKKGVDPPRRQSSSSSTNGPAKINGVVSKVNSTNSFDHLQVDS